MLVVQQVKLIEGWTGHLPMRFLIQIAQGDRIRQQLVLLGHLQPYWFLELKGQGVVDRSVGLDFPRMLMKVRLCTDPFGGFGVIRCLCYRLFSFLRSSGENTLIAGCSGYSESLDGTYFSHLRMVTAASAQSLPP